MIAAAGTAGFGFLSLLLFRVPSLRNFGAFTAFGMLAAVALELSFIPACRSILPAPKRSPRRDGPDLLGWGLAYAGRVSEPRVAVATLAVWGAFAAVGLAGIPLLDTNSSFTSYLPKASEVRRNIATVERHFDGTTPLVIEAVGDPGAFADPKVLGYLDQLAGTLRADPAVARVMSLVDLLAYASSALSGDGSDASLPLPADRRAIAELLFLTYSPPYERVLDRSFSRSAIWAYLRTDETKAIDAVIERAKRFVAENPPPPTVRVLVAGGIGAASVAINEEATRGKVWNIAAIFIVVFLIGAGLFRSWLAGGLIVLPLVVSLLLNLGLLGWSGTELDLATATILATSVGIGADFAIYLLSRIREERRDGSGSAESLSRALATSGKAIWFVALAISAGLLVLCPFDFRPVRMCGLLVPLAMVITCAASSTLIPALVALVKPRFLEMGHHSRGRSPMISLGRRSRAHSTAIVFCVCIAAELIAATPLAAGLPVGATLGADNASAAEGLLPPEILELYRKGRWRNPIAEWPDGAFRHGQPFTRGTEGNRGRLGLDEAGTIVEKATGTPAETIIGFPFPTIERDDPRAGLEVVWNYFYGVYDAGNLDGTADVAWVGKRGLERSASFQSSVLYYDGQEPKYRPKDNPQDLLLQTLVTVISPEDLSDTTFLVWRFREAAKRDLDWSYLPALRRVRELSPANRSDGFLGSDLTQDDGLFFDGKPQDFTWKLVGDAEMYRLADPYSLGGETAPRALAGGGFSIVLRATPIAGFEDASWQGAPAAPVGAALARRRLWIVEGTPKDPGYLYARIQLAIDRETYQGAWSRKFTADGELVADYAAVAFLNREVLAADGAKEWVSAPGIAYFGAINFKLDRATVTGFPLANRATTELLNRIRYDPRVFDFQALGRGGR